MNNVEEYYKQLELTQPVDVRRVYLASDDPTVLKDARAKYEFLFWVICDFSNFDF